MMGENSETISSTPGQSPARTRDTEQRQSPVRYPGEEVVAQSGVMMNDSDDSL